MKKIVQNKLVSFRVEGGEVTHYEVLTSVAKELKNKVFGSKVRKILKENKGI